MEDILHTLQCSKAYCHSLVNRRSFPLLVFDSNWNSSAQSGPRAYGLLRNAHPQLRFAHPRLRLKQQQLRSKDRNGSVHIDIPMWDYLLHTTGKEKNAELSLHTTTKDERSATILRGLLAAMKHRGSKILLLKSRRSNFRSSSLSMRHIGISTSKMLADSSCWRTQTTNFPSVDLAIRVRVQPPTNVGPSFPLIKAYLCQPIEA